MFDILNPLNIASPFVLIEGAPPQDNDMAFTHAVSTSVSTGGATIASSSSYSAASSIGLDESVPISTNHEIDISFLVAKVVSFVILSDQVVTIKTNSSGSPADTVVLVAGVSYLWNTDSLDTFKFTTDVTKLFVTNASSAAANFSMQCLSST